MARVGKLGGKGEMSVLETSTLGLCEAWIWERIYDNEETKY